MSHAHEASILLVEKSIAEPPRASKVIASVRGPTLD